jgi:hypothetical protein
LTQWNKCQESSCLLPQTPESPTLDIASDTLAFIIEKAREFDVKESDSDPDSGSNPTDDGNADILEDKADDATREELVGAIRELNEDERAELIALAWLGRGTYDLEEWDEAISTAVPNMASAPPNISSACRCWAIIWKTAWPCSTKALSTRTTPPKALNAENEPLGNMPDAKPDRAL